MSFFDKVIPSLSNAIECNNGKRLAILLQRPFIATWSIQKQNESPGAMKIANHQSGTLLLSQLPSDLEYLNDIEKVNKSPEQFENFLKRNQIHPPFTSVVSHFLRSHVHLYTSKDLCKAFSSLKLALLSFLEVLKASINEIFWVLPVLNVLVMEIRVYAEYCDTHLPPTDTHPPHYFLQSASRVLQKCFQLTISDRSAPPQSKKMSSLYIVCTLFKIYVRLNNFSLFNSIFRTLDSQNFPPLEVYPPSQLVTLHFFNGRYKIYQGKYTQAEHDLMAAFSLCPLRYSHNLRLILFYLVPIRLIKGVYPTDDLLDTYGLRYPFESLISSCKRGDIHTYTAALENNRNFLISKGVFFVWEHVRLLVYRNLFYKVYTALNTTKLPLTAFVSALSFLGETVTLLDVECMLVNLCNNDLIKGYLSNTLGYLVVSKNNPFPKLSLVNTPH